MLAKLKTSDEISVNPISLPKNTPLCMDKSMKSYRFAATNQRPFSNHK